MKLMQMILTRRMCRPCRCLLAAATAAVIVVILSSAAFGVTVQTYNRKLEGGKADFGSGFHSFGSPGGNGTITFDYSIVDGSFLVTARVNGTLYLDSLTGGGCARLTIRYRGFSHNNIAVERVDLCGPGGDANSTSNKAVVSESFASADLWHVHVSVNEVQNGTLLSGASTSVAAPSGRSYGVKINSGTADFGGFYISRDHVSGSPQHDAQVVFSRVFSSGLECRIQGTLYWDSLTSSGCARAVFDFRSQSDVLMERQTFDHCGPGFDANSPTNQLQIDSAYELNFEDRSFFRVRLRVGTLSNGSFVGVTTKTLDFNGVVGSFELQPLDPVVPVNQPLGYALTWNVPEPLNWHDLRTIDLRIGDDTETILWLRWDEASNSFSLFNEATGRFNRAFSVGSNARLQTPQATLDLSNTTVSALTNPLGSGPTSPSVLLDLALSFKPPAAGRTFRVDVAATDDSGNEDPFVEAGRLTVSR